MTEPDVTRTEYEQFIKIYEVRHSELRLEMKELESDIKTNINGISNKVDLLSLQFAKRGIDAWKLMATSSVSIIVGYVLATLQHTFLR